MKVKWHRLKRGMKFHSSVFSALNFAYKGPWSSEETNLDKLNQAPTQFTSCSECDVVLCDPAQLAPDGTEGKLF